MKYKIISSTIIRKTRQNALRSFCIVFAGISEDQTKKQNYRDLRKQKRKARAQAPAFQ